MTARLIVALGNPGAKYKKTRHNAAWLFLDTMYPDLEWKEGKNAQVAESDGIVWIKPTTFMNLSGEAVKQVWDKHGGMGKNPTAHDLLVIHDEVEAPSGTIRWQSDRAAAGHNGVRSIIENFNGWKGFQRLRLGIGTAPEHMPLDTYVLQSFESEEYKKNIAAWTAASKNLLEDWITGNTTI